MIDCLRLNVPVHDDGDLRDDGKSAEGIGGRERATCRLILVYNCTNQKHASANACTLPYKLLSVCRFPAYYLVKIQPTYCRSNNITCFEIYLYENQQTRDQGRKDTGVKQVVRIF